MVELSSGLAFVQSSEFDSTILEFYSMILEFDLLEIMLVDVLR